MKIRYIFIYEKGQLKMKFNTATLQLYPNKIFRDKFNKYVQDVYTGKYKHL